ncbi:hypothetical protein F5Y05DRAFT_420533 [Hypoxylon sp. FL0543]|nr:hypothetical protein F5Y05DRAFT_420533 [Hypoxylon sp. FL0543]
MVFGAVLRRSTSQNVGFNFDRAFQLCQATLTEGTAVSVGSGCSILSTIPFGPSVTQSLVVGSLGAAGSNTVPANQLTIQASAQGIFLLGQSLSSESSASTTSSSSILESSSPAATDSDGDPVSTVSTRTAIGASVGSAVVAILLFSLGFFLIRRHRKRRLGAARGEEGQDPPKPGTGDDDHHGVVKPELEGSNADPAQFKKAELDPNATRLELPEGYVRRELEGKEVPVTRELDSNERPQELPETVVRYELE